MEDSNRIRRRDTTKGAPLRILSLDGGGVRGYSIFIILQELMHRTYVEMHGRAPKRHEVPKPCDHFDLIGGTGTGGLIAIMLGRLRMDIETCKDVYVRMTRRVFQTDKTIAGIPYKSSLFKASKLEEAIRDCVREHTIYEEEGNDVLSSAVPMTSEAVASPFRADGQGMPQRSMSQSSRYSQVGRSPTSSIAGMNFSSTRWGNSNALLYDTRDNRTKTAVTAVFKGARGAESTVLLRSYDSRKEPPPDVNCTIWQAGRATSATGLAFKPIQVGQHVYHDDGAGEFNPAPIMLDEAVQNEWPGRDVGLFVSIGTGKRPNTSNASNQALWWEGFMGGTVGSFAEARRRLIAKIEGCEDTHQFMLRQHLAARGVNVDNYYRFNVEVGVGEFAMNEYDRLGEISTNTRMYLSRTEMQTLSVQAASKLARAYFAEVRQRRSEARKHLDGDEQQGAIDTRQELPADRNPSLLQSNPNAVELPGDGLFGYVPTNITYPPRGPYEHRGSIADQKYTVVQGDAQPGADSGNNNQYNVGQVYQRSGFDTTPPRSSHEMGPQNFGAPPLPPKTPLPYANVQYQQYPQQQQQQHPAERYSNHPRHSINEPGRTLPYPDLDGPPPVVNTANKPSIRR